MSTQVPFIDILLATRDGARFVEEQIASIQLQSFQGWKLLVSDDCSQDDTLDIIRCLALIDARIRIVSESKEFGSAKANFMRLLASSDAPYVMFCDQDDVWFPEKVEKTLAGMRELEAAHGMEEPLLVFSDMAVVDERLALLAPSFERYSNLDPRRTGFAHVLAQALGAGCTFMMNRTLVELALSCTDCHRIIMHDWWVALVASAFGHIGYVDEPLSLYRQHGDNAVGASRFDIARWIQNPASIRTAQELIAAQAGCFTDTYTGIADGRYIKAADHCASSCEGSRFQNVIHLAKSGAWKIGVRKAGQVVAAMGGVVAIVITYNPDIRCLEENIRSISSQVAMVFVYDNASENIEDVVLLLSKMGVAYKLSYVNDGLAMGLNVCCGAACECGARYALLLDQDSVASEGMVEGLLRYHYGDVGIVCPQIVDRNTREGCKKGLGVQFLKRTITSGSLISLDAWKDIGGFDEHLFVDWVDIEFCANLRSHGYRIIRNNETWLLHEMGRREYAFTVPLLHRAFYRTNHSVERQMDKARSQAVLKWKYGFSRVGIEERFHILTIRLRDLLLERGRLAIFMAFAAGTREGKRVVSRMACEKVQHGF